MTATKKWADYLVSAVRYNTQRERIEKVKVHEDKGESIGNAKEWARKEVVAAITENSTFCTILRSNDNKWRRGEDIHVVVVGGEKFIRTDANAEKQDNLGELPEF